MEEEARGSDGYEGGEAEGKTEGGAEGFVFRDGEKEYTREQLTAALKDSENKSEWQKSYTRRDMELADMKRGLAKTQQLEQYLNEHPEKYSQIEAIFKEQAKEGKASMPPEMAEMLPRLKELESTLSEQNARIQLKEELGELKANFKDYFDGNPELERMVVSHALKLMDEHPDAYIDLRLAMKDLMFDQVQEDSLRQGQQMATAARKRSLELGQPRGSRGVPVDMKKQILGEKTYRGAIEKYLDASGE
jgi:hypothetical protein